MISVWLTISLCLEVWMELYKYDIWESKFWINKHICNACVDLQSVRTEVSPPPCINVDYNTNNKTEIWEFNTTDTRGGEKTMLFDLNNLPWLLLFVTDCRCKAKSSRKLRIDYYYHLLLSKARFPPYWCASLSEFAHGNIMEKWKL